MATKKIFQKACARFVDKDIYKSAEITKLLKSHPFIIPAVKKRPSLMPDR